MRKAPTATAAKAETALPTVATLAPDGGIDAAALLAGAELERMELAGIDIDEDIIMLVEEAGIEDEDESSCSIELELVTAADEAVVAPAATVDAAVFEPAAKQSELTPWPITTSAAWLTAPVLSRIWKVTEVPAAMSTTHVNEVSEVWGNCLSGVAEGWPPGRIDTK